MMGNVIRRGYELKTLFFGRPIRPFHFAVTIATAVIAVANLTPDGGMTFLAHQASFVLGIAASLSVVFLTVGWWFKNEWTAEWGLLLATGVWLSRAIYIIWTGDSFITSTSASVVLSLAWTVGAGGAYILERYDHVISKEEDE